MGSKFLAFLVAVLLVLCAAAQPQSSAKQSSRKDSDDPDARPPVTQADIQIVQQAQNILDSPAKWNRADTRICPADARTFSLYCALEKATVEVTGNFQHRGAAMQESRFVIEEVAPNRNYHHRLMDYNNDPATSFADVQKVLRLLQERIKDRLAKESTNK